MSISGESVLKTARLLLVDDNQDNLEVLSIILGQKYDVSSYTCPQQALTGLESAKPDLVLLDIGMSPIDGVQCLKAIRAVPGFDTIPAIALTAYARDVERKSFLADGFQAVVTKPILDPQQLFTSIAALLASEVASSDETSVRDSGCGQSGDAGCVVNAPCLDSTHRMTA